MIIIYALVLCSIKAQEPIFNTVELSSSFRINSFAEDNNGFLWMATKEGLVFYNGFEDLKIDSASGAYYDLVLYGDFIISGKDNGKIEVFNTQTKRIEYNIQLPSKKRINNLFLSDEKIYVSTNGDGLFVVDNLFQNPNVYQYPGNYTKYLYKIVYSSNSDRFIISSDRGLYTLVKGDSIINKHKYFPDVIVNNLTLDESNLWCATYDSGLILLDLQTDSLSKYDQQTDEKIQDIVVHENTVYFCKESGLWTLGQDGNLSEINSLCLIENIGNLFLDSESNLWVGGKESTLCKGNLLFQIIPHNLSSDIQTIFEISDRIIIGSQQGLFFRKENGRWEKVINNNITHISGFNNYLLIGSYSNGLFILDNNLKVLKNITSKNGLINDAILDCHQVENGNYIVSTLAGLQSINLSTSNNEISLEADALFEKYQFHDYFLEVFKDEKAGMLLGTDKAGLVQIDNKVVRIDSLNDKKVGSIYSITRAKDRTLWLSSSNLGLLKFNKDSLQVIEEIQFDGDPYTSIIPLEKNHLLLVRKKSIDLYDVDNNNIIYFNKEINLSHREAYFNNYFVNEKNCYFVHNNEIYKFHLPDENVKVRPFVSIDKVEVNLENIDLKETSFKETENNFNFSLTGSWLKDPTNVIYAYQLIGLNNDWYITRDRAVRFPQLPHGKYTFNVKSSENVFFGDIIESTYSFEIKQDIFNKPWFRILLIIGALAFIYWLLEKNQSQKQLKSELEQRKMEAMLLNLKSQLKPHFLFNSFNTLSAIIEESQEKSITFIENLTDFYRMILTIGDKKLVPLQIELELVCAYMHILKTRFADNLNLIINISKPIGFVPPLSLQMLIENAVKHNQATQKKPLNIEILQKEDMLIVVNNINKKNRTVHSTGLGLKNIEERYRIISSKKISVINNEREFKVSIPLLNENHHPLKD